MYDTIRHMSMTERGVRHVEEEKVSHPTHIIKTERPTGKVDTPAFSLTTNTDFFSSHLTDAANFPDGVSAGMFRLEAHAKTDAIAEIVRTSAIDKKGLVVVGTQSSLTGAAVPNGEYLLDMIQLKHISDVQKNYAIERINKLLKNLEENKEVKKTIY